MTETKSKKTESKRRAISNENSFLMYLSEINRIPLLNRDEEEKTAKLAAQGNKAAIDRLVNANLRFVVTVAKKYQNRGLPLEDLISEGNIGLMNAIKHFEVKKGYRFITYAIWWIRQSILKAINDKGRIIRLPVYKSKALIKMERARMEIQNEPDWMREKDIRNTAMMLNMVPEEAVNLINVSQDVLSLDDSACNSDDTSTIKDCIEDKSYPLPDEYAVNNILKEELDAVIKKLGQRDAEIIRCRFGLKDNYPMTLTEVGNRYNLTRERVRQIELHALKVLQLSSRNGILQSYLAS
jgi:RNA polymerase primary sigma factor